MPLHFKRIALMGRYGTEQNQLTLENLANFLELQGAQVFIEVETQKLLSQASHYPCFDPTQNASVDLMIVVGGDGSLLSAAHIAVEHDIPLIGINRGHLGFLTDLSPDGFENILQAILQGQYIQEPRFLLNAWVESENGRTPLGMALNDVVLYAGEVARMIEFEVYINQQFVYSQRSDGLIIATPTGSTAYALSAGGPIIHPSLQSIALVPMFPHTLTARPLVIDSHAQIELRIARVHGEAHPAVSCDGQALVTLVPGARVYVARKEKDLKLIHPQDHDYYRILRTKLDWGKRLKSQYFIDPND